MKRLIPLLPLLAATAAGAQTRHDTNAPIDFGANQIQLQDKANRAVLTGSVAVKQAEMTLNAQRVTVAYTGQVVDGNPQVSRLDAAGGVVVRRPNQVAKSQYAVYDLNRRVITMIGAVSLQQGGANTVNGGRLTINLDSGRAVIDGSTAAGGNSPVPGGTVTTAPSGRVTGTFSVPKRAQSDKPSTPSDSKN
ncbi:MULTISPECIES: LptA/OstA family protein [Sphingomonas]|uniref:LptA/OstA family protein n=1 Tax=Sphingomonas lycopersici TaxID=2951807 RepID=A0AA41ZDV0_9SPHN|nr:MULTISPECIES: LptA/OstA family protein [Sphingomonas]MCW6535089.1 LptA/OstA family protein [Sphingomonas lycopersici]OJU19528.1 MAG: OstA family protein [Sphingomonas sp. 66-10]